MFLLARCLSSSAYLCSNFDTSGFSCENTGVGLTSCTEPYPLVHFKEPPAAVTWNDIVLYMIVSSKTIRRTVIDWWLQFVSKETLGNDHLTLILIADACDAGNSCQDAATALQSEISSVNKLIDIYVVRGLLHIDTGYQRLACKLMTGIKEIFRLFPTKKYYFKMDDDTVLFPKRLLHFISALDRSTNSTGTPLYFGTVSHLSKSIPLCGELGWVVNSKEPGGGHVTYSQKNREVEGYSTCYAQGGAGYGLNNLAMKSLAATPPCTKDMDLESSSEDTYVGFALFRNLNTTLIHCGSFRPSGLHAEGHLRHAISFHHISDHWMATRNISDMRTKYSDFF